MKGHGFSLLEMLTVADGVVLVFGEGVLEGGTPQIGGWWMGRGERGGGGEIYWL